MNVIPLTIKCPKCGSGKVAYSCEPECCFNHVCEDCLGSFELTTRDLGRTASGLVAEPGEKDPCAPTARCAKCQSLNLASLDVHQDSTAVCLVCGAVLELICQ